MGDNWVDFGEGWFIRGGFYAKVEAVQVVEMVRVGLKLNRVVWGGEVAGLGGFRLGSADVAG